ncbi:MAG: hypothetical protein WAT26_11520 [Saprospiraceae bacterium]|nr:hypothetical protein [Saprospiraceae bacterium]
MKYSSLTRCIIVICLNIIFTFNLIAQRGFELEDETESYDWSKFNLEEFVYSAIVCALVILLGLKLNNSASNSYLKGFGLALFYAGSIGAFATLGGPIIGAIEILFKVAFYSAIFIGIFYFIYKEFVEKK